MKKLHFLGNGKLEFLEVEDLNPGPGQVVVKTAATVICGSEMKSFRGTGQPGNGGHEGAGVILKIGEGVSNLKPGMRVGLSPVTPCDDPNCPACSVGKYTWCPHFKYYGDFHAEQILESARALLPLPDDVGWDVATLITGDGMGVPYHSSRKFINPDAKTVAVFGAGPIGLGNVIMQKYLSRKVIALDYSEARLEFARRFGADSAVNLGACDNAVRAVQEWADADGADVAMECSGHPNAVHNCIASVRRGGQVILNGEQGEVPLNISGEFIRRDITVTGSWFYHFREYQEMLGLYRKGLDVSSLITHRFPFAEAQAAYDLFAAGKAGKVMLTY
ncbi:MAG: zinc-binding dehydrogenase [Victivallales bacterium]|nr:zinc-binding dehydrogenase [Victivallales bacterium]